MKKLIFGLFATVLLGFTGNSQVKSLTPASSAEYYNYVIQKSELADKVKVLEVRKIGTLNFEKIQKASTLINPENFKSSTETDLLFKGQKFTLFTVPLKDGFKTLTFLQNEDNLDINPVLVNIDTNYKYNWESTSTSSRFRGISRDCKTGGGQVTAIGAAIAFGGFFGCLPCPFVGGAIAVLGGMSAFCP